MTVDSQRARTMSGKELRIKLFDLMKTKGILDDVKSNLRKNLIDELRGVNQFRPTDVSNPSLLVRVVNTLIVEHLKICDYDYTLSVFIPEAQLNDYKSISNDEIFKLLNISKESHFYKKIESQLSNTENKNSLLLNFISSISFYLPESTQSTSCQTTYDLWTGSVAGNTLDEKLSTLDLMYDSRQQDESKHVTTEEKLLLFQKRIEQKLQDEFKQQIEQFRVNEIKKIHEEERLKCQMELQSLKKELEHAYQSKHETLSEKETRISERFKTELENEKRDLYGQRQTFLDELKSMKLRETDFQRDLQLRERQVTCYNMIPAITLEADRIKRLETDMSKRELTLQNTELYIDQQVQAKLSKLRFEIEQQLMERNKSLQILEIRNQEESKRLAEERLICEQSKMELIQYKKQLSQVDSIIYKLQSEVKILTNENEILKEKTKQSMDYMSIREENAILKSKMDENLTNRSQKSHIHRYNNESGSDDTPRKLDSHILSDQLKKVFDSQLVEHRVMNEELVDLKTQIALLQTQEGMGKMNENLLLKSKNIDYLSHVLVQSEDVQDYYPSTLSSNYNQFIDDAKLRMLELDKEADRVEEYFRDYQHRTLNKVNYVQQSDDSNYNRRMPSLPLKLNRNSTTTPITKMPGSTSLQDIRTQKYWAKEERLIRLPESYLPIRDPLSPDNLVFEHPELTVKVSALDDELQRRMQQQQSRTGSVPNLIEHPDIRQPLQLQPVLPSTSKITRQMSADVNVQRSPSPASSITSPIHERHYSAPSKKQDDQLSLSLDQHWFQQQQLIPNNNRAISLRSNITDILEKPEHDKNDINPSTTNRDDQHQRHVEIIREYSDTSTVSDDQTNRNKPKATATTVQKSATNGKSPSDDDFW